jgi:hypothetical protein
MTTGFPFVFGDGGERRRIFGGADGREGWFF